MRGARVCPGLEKSAAVPNTKAEMACERLCMTKSSSTRSLIIRFNNLHVPSVKTRLLDDKKGKSKKSLFKAGAC